MNFNLTLIYQEICHLALFTKTEESINQESIFFLKESVIIEDNMISENDMKIKKDMIDLFPSIDQFLKVALIGLNI